MPEKRACLPLPSQPQLVLVYWHKTYGRRNRPFSEIAEPYILNHKMAISNTELNHTTCQYGKPGILDVFTSVEYSEITFVRVPWQFHTIFDTNGYNLTKKTNLVNSWSKSHVIRDSDVRFTVTWSKIMVIRLIYSSQNLRNRNYGDEHEKWNVLNVGSCCYVSSVGAAIDL